MLTDKKVILFGAGTAGQIALHYYGPERVYCFVDNNKPDRELYGKEVISFEKLLQIHDQYDVLISTNYKTAEVIQKQCSEYDIYAVPWDINVSWRDYPSNPAIKKFEGRYNGKRCFLIGNGPSLRAEDLTKLHEHGEITFGCNNIDRIFPETQWRPDYFFAADTAVMQLNYEHYAELDAKVKLFQNPEQIFYGDSNSMLETLKNGKGEICFFNKLVSCDINKSIPFSEDPSKAMYISGTVMYIMLQMSVYMGFREIYLLGVDNTAVYVSNMQRDISGSHFYTDINEENAEISALRGDLDGDTIEKFVDSGYHYAKEYCDGHGIRILNATRGGKLEVYPRVDFDALF